MMSALQIREFQPGDEAAFRDLNVEWIERFFRIEPPDEAVLSNPQTAILDSRGRIFFAVRDGACIGCCALLRTGEHEFEVAKMAVTPAAQGSGAGRAILTAVIEEARRIGARRLFLETNRVMAPAIHLYESLGFRHIPADRVQPSSYARSDVAMEFFL